jgi:hypothetical protein
MPPGAFASDKITKARIESYQNDLDAKDSELANAKAAVERATKKLEKIKKEGYDSDEYTGDCSKACQSSSCSSVRSEYKITSSSGSGQETCMEIYRATHGNRGKLGHCYDMVMGCGTVQKQIDKNAATTELENAQTKVDSLTAETTALNRKIDRANENCVDCRREGGGLYGGVFGGGDREPTTAESIVNGISAITPMVLGGLSTYQYSKGIKGYYNSYDKMLGQCVTIGVPCTPPGYGVTGLFGNMGGLGVGGGVGIGGYGVGGVGIGGGMGGVAGGLIVGGFAITGGIGVGGGIGGGIGGVGIGGMPIGGYGVGGYGGGYGSLTGGYGISTMPYGYGMGTPMLPYGGGMGGVGVAGGVIAGGFAITGGIGIGGGLGGGYGAPIAGGYGMPYGGIGYGSPIAGGYGGIGIGSPIAGGYGGLGYGAPIAGGYGGGIGYGAPIAGGYGGGIGYGSPIAGGYGGLGYGSIAGGYGGLGYGSVAGGYGGLPIGSGYGGLGGMGGLGVGGYGPYMPGGTPGAYGGGGYGGGIGGGLGGIGGYNPQYGMLQQASMNSASLQYQRAQQSQQDVMIGAQQMQEAQYRYNQTLMQTQSFGGYGGGSTF